MAGPSQDYIELSLSVPFTPGLLSDDEKERLTKKLTDMARMEITTFIERRGDFGGFHIARECPERIDAEQFDGEIRHLHGDCGQFIPRGHEKWTSNKEAGE